MTEAVRSATLASVRRSLALAVLLALPVAACGEEDTVTVEATPAAMAQAAEDTLDAGTGRFESTMVMNVLGNAVDMEMTGAFDGPAGLSSVSVDMGSLAEGLGENVPADQLAGLGGTMEMVLDGEVMFMCWDLLQMLAGARCGSVDVSEVVGTELPIGNTDPTAFTRALAGAEDVEELGTETVDGVETQHFSGTYRLASALETLDPEQAAALEASFEQFGDQIVDAELPFEVWVDGDGRVRRMVQEMEVLGSTVSFEQRYFDFGADVDIQVPEGDVPDLGALFEQLSALGG